MDKKKTLTKEKVLKVGKRILICIGALILAGIIAIVGINLLVIATTSGRILSI